MRKSVATAHGLRMRDLQPRGLDLANAGNPEPAQKVDQIDELMRIVGVQGKGPPPRRPKVLSFARRRRSR